MKQLILNIFTYFIWTATAAGIPMLLGFARSVHYQRPLRQIEVKPLNKHLADFVPAEEIINQIRHQGFADFSLNGLNNRTIETLLSQNPYIGSVQAYTTLDRVLVIRFSERVPFMRVIDITGQWYYLDSAGVIFPDKPERLFRLLPAIGYIQAPVKLPDSHIALATDTIHNKVYNAILQLGQLINKDEFARLLIDHIYVDEQQQIELIPVLGKAGILLGKASNLGVKLANVAAFYKAKTTTEEFGRYAQINASFENQIVCIIKRDSI